MKNKKNNEIRIFLNKIIGFLSLSLFSIGSGFSLNLKTFSKRKKRVQFQKIKLQKFRKKEKSQVQVIKIERFV